MKRYRSFKLFAALLGLLGGIVSGCNDSHTRLSSLMSDPYHYLHHEVRVVGEVNQVYELPLGITNLAAYRISDGTGQIWIVSHAGAPIVGDRVGLRGRLEPIANLNLPVLGNILGNVIQEQDRRVHGR